MPQRLGIILGTKIFINFAKYPIEECMRKLKKEIQNFCIEKDEIKKEAAQTTALNTAYKSDVKNWSTEVIKTNIYNIHSCLSIIIF